MQPRNSNRTISVRPVCLLLSLVEVSLAESTVEGYRWVCRFWSNIISVIILLDDSHGLADQQLSEFRQPVRVAVADPPRTGAIGHQQHCRHAGTSSPTQNYYQSIDLSENELQALAGFSYLDRLRTLSANNNKIRFLYGLSHNLPALENLLLMANRIEDFAEVRSLAACKNLKRLVLIGNPVTERPHYRLFAVHHLRALTTLDFRKVTKQERQQAAKLYGKSAP